MDKSQYFHRLILFLIVSLLLHFGFYEGLNRWAPEQHFRNSQQPIEVSLFEQSPENIQFVTDPEVGKIAEKLENHAKYLSKLTRRVQKERIAKEIGKTKNRVQKDAHELSSKIIKESIKNFSPNGDLAFSAKDEIRVKNTREGFDTLPSTLSEHIPNVEYGDFTALNTDEFSYYAFFNRINEQIRYRWTANIRQLAIELPTPIINRLAAFPRVSRIELVLDKNGEFVSTFVDGSSGSTELDQAAINAFMDASPYLNPPKDLVNEDGYIRLNYAFRVVWSPRYVAKDRSLGN